MAACGVPLLLLTAARAAWHSRWWGLLSVAAQTALATTLSGAGALALDGPTGYEEPCLGDVLSDAIAAPLESRLPLR